MSSKLCIPQPLEWMEDDPFYNVQELLDHRITSKGKRKIIEYLVRWEGVAPSGDTYEPRGVLIAKVPQMIEAYDALHASTDHPVPILIKAKPTPEQPKAASRSGRTRTIPAKLLD